MTEPDQDSMSAVSAVYVVVIVLSVLVVLVAAVVILPHRAIQQAGEWVVSKGNRFGVPCRCVFRCCPKIDGDGDLVPNPDRPAPGQPQEEAARRTVYTSLNAAFRRPPSISI